MVMTPIEWKFKKRKSEYAEPIAPDWLCTLFALAHAWLRWQNFVRVALRKVKDAVPFMVTRDAKTRQW